MEKFRKLGISENTLKALEKKGFEEPTPIQAKTIPLLIKGFQDVIGQAQTGTGKTAAFGIPLIEKLEENQRHVQAIILTPTRELAIQVSEEINSLKNKKLSIFPIYGGQSIEPQIKKLQKGIDIVVGTPGRVLDHINRGTLDLSHVSYAVLDEADEMLNMGFIDDVEKILKTTNRNKKMLLFSATIPPKILNLAKKYMRNYEVIRIEKEITTNLIDQIYFEVQASDRFEALWRIIDLEPEFYGLIFCRTKNDVKNVSRKLRVRGYDVDCLHGDMTQSRREKILEKFKTFKINILVATDVAARGIDVNDLTHVINYALPQDLESYIHRIGRTGRSGKKGTAITFITPSEYRKLKEIKKMARVNIRKEELPMVNDEKYNKRYDDREITIDQKGKTRLFVARGRLDGMNPDKLLVFISKEAKVDTRVIKNIRIYDKFSFIEAPFQEAEKILKKFQEKSNGRRSIIEKAVQKKRYR